MDRVTDARNHRSRRRDRRTAERVNLAALTARAFDLQAARNYLRLSGFDDDFIEAFAARFPYQVRAAEPNRVDRRGNGRGSRVPDWERNAGMADRDIL